MRKFEQNKNSDYYIKEKLSNGQTLYIEFQTEYRKECCGFWVYLIVYKKRKHLLNDGLFCKSTGDKLGIKTLLIAREIIIEFENFIKDIVTKKREEGLISKDLKYYIEVGWDDNRRRKVYERGLKKYGYDYTYEEGFKYLRKRII